jgi:hypothetical protein
MAKKKSSRNVVTLADKVRLGPEIAALKARTPRKQWVAMVKGAHARGFTVAGALSGAPDPLKERTRSSLVAEANKTVTEAFKPAEQELSQRDAKIRALDAKRQADEAHFQDWLKTQHEALASRAMNADAELERRQREIQAETQQGYQQAQAGARQTAAATPGNVSDPSQSTALDLSADAQRANEMVANQRQQSASQAANAKGYAIAGRAVSVGLSQQANTRRASETAAALSEVNADRSDLMAKRAAAAAEEVRRLFGVEIEKADSNRNYAAAASQLGIKQDELALDAAKAARDEDYRRDKLKQDRDIASERNATSIFRIESSAEQKAKDRALREKLKAAGGDASPAEIRASNKMAGRLNQIAAYLKSKRKAKTKTPLRDLAAQHGASSVEYELALDLAVHGKLSAVNRRRALQLGILTPEDL